MSTSPVTEIAHFPIKLARSEADPIAQKSLKDDVSTITGYQTAYHGYELEHDNLLYWFIHWDTLAHHQAMMTHPSYEPFIQTVLSFAGPPSLLHSEQTPHHAPDLFRTNDVVEYASLTLDPSTDKAAWEASVVEAGKAIAESTRGYGFRGMSWGPRVSDEDPEGRNYILLIGWESLEAHRKWKREVREEKVAEALTPFRKGVVAEKTKVVHVKIEGEIKATTVT